MKLNLGSGNVRLPDCINVDIEERPGYVDQIVDLSQYPWPWEDDSVEEIFAHHIVEHLWELVPFMNECHRILKPGGILSIKTPDPLCPWFWQDPTHVRGYMPNTFTIYTTYRVGDYPSYGLKKWSEADAYWNDLGLVNGVEARELIATLVK